MHPFFISFCSLILFGIINHAQAFIPTLNDKISSIRNLLDIFDQFSKIDVNISDSTNQTSSQPSLYPTSIPTSIQYQLQTVPYQVTCSTRNFLWFRCSYFTYFIMFSGFIIIIAWLVSCYDQSMTWEQIAYQNIINIITIGDQVTDYLFIINLYFQLEHLHTQKIHGNPTASSKYHDTLLFIILISSFKCLVFFVNFFCALTFGELRLLVTTNYSLLKIIHCAQCMFVLTCTVVTGITDVPGDLLDHPNIVTAIFFTIHKIGGFIIVLLLILFLLSLVVISDLALFLSAMSNSELNFTLFGKKENKFPMTLIGLLVDDIPQLIVQIAYAIVENRKYYQKISPIQITSFAFISLRLFFVSYKKYKDEKHRLKGLEEGRNYRGVAMDGVAVAAEIFSA